jgi:DNA invertase Pin-like site-specific DNA recombinase
MGSNFTRVGDNMENTPATSNAPARSRAAQYVRMSTEHQQYSPENQLDIIQQYAADHNMEIVQVYSDHGRSSLNIAGREGINQLMSDVEHKRVNFTSLLVYDGSRWGRFQDVDESAYYEYVLKRAGIRVHYCAEQFENDGSMSSSVLKTLKRSMAAEYSRELWVKAFSGQCRLIKLKRFLSKALTCGNSALGSCHSIIYGRRSGNSLIIEDRIIGVTGAIE